MIISQKETDTVLQTWHADVLGYHIEISNQLPNPPSYRYLSQMSTKELFSSLQLSTFMLNNLLLTNQQAQYENQLRSYESQLRTQYGIRCMMKLKIEAMANKLMSLLSKDKGEPKTSKVNGGLLTQKENEILILRAENSNLKSTIAKMEQQSKAIQSNTNNKTKPNSNNNINININDISNSNVIIKTSERYASPATPIKRKKRECYLSSSQSNRNVFFGYSKGLLTPNKSSQNNLYQTKISSKDIGINEKSNYHSNTVKKHHKNTISNHNEVVKNSHHKSLLSNLIVYSSYQNSQNNTLAKGTIHNTPRTETAKEASIYNSLKR